MSLWLCFRYQVQPSAPVDEAVKKNSTHLYDYIDDSRMTPGYQVGKIFKGVFVRKFILSADE